MEGDSISGLINIIKKAGYNKDNEVRVGLITSLSPLKIAISSTIELESSDLKMSYSFKKQLIGEIGEVKIGENKYVVNIKDSDKVKVGDNVFGILENNEYYVIDRLVK